MSATTPKSHIMATCGLRNHLVPPPTATGTTGATRTDPAFRPAFRPDRLAQAEPLARVSGQASPARVRPAVSEFLDIDVQHARTRVDRLKPREREALGLLARGLDSHHVSVRMGISRRTLDVHRCNILNTLLHDSAEERTIVRAVLMYLAWKHGKVK